MYETRRVDKFKFAGCCCRLWMKVEGEGNSTTYDIKVDPDQGEPFVFKIIGGIEMSDFVEGLTAMNKQYNATDTSPKAIDEWEF